MLIKLPKTELTISQNTPANLIAEIGLNHNGSLLFAKELITQSVLSGAQLIKLQKRSPEDLAIPELLDSPFHKCPGLGNDQRNLRNSHEFTKDQFIELIDYAAEYNAKLFTSVFDLKSLEFALDCGIDLIKIASHSATNQQLLEKTAEAGVNVILSVGGCSIEEIDKSVSFFKSESLILMHCVSSYPTTSANAYLGNINLLRSRFPDIPIGFSSHEIGSTLSICSASLGACLIERHITLSKSLQGFDHKISLTPDQFSQLAIDLSSIRDAFQTRHNILPSEYPARHGYHCGLYSSQDLPEGHVIGKQDILFMQPANDPLVYLTGLESDQIIGKILSKPIKQYHQFTRLS